MKKNALGLLVHRTCRPPEMISLKVASSRLGFLLVIGQGWSEGANLAQPLP